MNALRPLGADEVRRRYLILRAVRWLPSGLLIPVFVVLLQSRGMTLADVGVVAAAQGVMIMALELPTGGLADSIGRRRVLLLASGFDLAAMVLLAVGTSLPVLVLGAGLMGVYRALESGPLDAWYVDAAQAADPDADIETGLARAGAVIGVSIATGSVLSSLLVATSLVPGVDPLVGPVVVAAAIRVVELVVIARLVVEPRRSATTDRPDRVRTVIATSLAAVRRSAVLRRLVAIELAWGAGMVSFETFTPARLADVLDDPDRAAALLGPTSAVAWFVFSLGAANAARLARRIGAPRAGALLLGLQATAVVAIGFAGHAAGIVGAFVAVMLVHGGANPVYQGLLHRAVDDGRRRATILSVASLMASAGGAVGGIALGALADASGIPSASVVGAGLLALAGVLFLAVGRRVGTDTPDPDPVVVATAPGSV